MRETATLTLAANNLMMNKIGATTLAHWIQELDAITNSGNELTLM
jgi:hypothetical protein